MACAGLGIFADELAGRLKDRTTMTLRQLVAKVGIERWDQRAERLGSILGKHRDVVSVGRMQARKGDPRIRSLPKDKDKDRQVRALQFHSSVVP